jgi:hypothetical protein
MTVAEYFQEQKANLLRSSRWVDFIEIFTLVDKLYIGAIALVHADRPQLFGPPPSKWSALRYALWQQGGRISWLKKPLRSSQGPLSYPIVLTSGPAFHGFVNITQFVFI